MMAFSATEDCWYASNLSCVRGYISPTTDAPAQRARIFSMAGKFRMYSLTPAASVHRLLSDGTRLWHMLHRTCISR